MAAFQSYAGAYVDERETFRWSCYATCAVYEVRSFDDRLPEPPVGRKWVRKPQHGQTGPHVAVLVDQRTSDFSQMLTQITRPKGLVDA